jgi:hypothetical protein
MPGSAFFRTDYLYFPRKSLRVDLDSLLMQDFSTAACLGATLGRASKLSA